MERRFNECPHRSPTARLGRPLLSQCIAARKRIQSQVWRWPGLAMSLIPLSTSSGDSNEEAQLMANGFSPWHTHHELGDARRALGMPPANTDFPTGHDCSVRT